MSTSRAIPVFSVFCLALLAACGRGAPPPAAAGAAPEVGVVTLAPRAVDRATQLPGRTSAYRIAEVRPQVDGIVLKRLFTEGSEVRAGQALYEIDSAPYRAALLQAEAALASAEAQQNASRLLAERLVPLHEQGAVSKQDYDNAVAADRSSAAAVAAAKAAVEAARINMNYTQVRSPIAGRIGRSLVTEGALVTRNQEGALATVAQLDPIYVDVTQSSAELLRLQRDFKEGRLQRDAKQKVPVTVVLEDGTTYPHTGSLQFTEVTVESGTGSVLLRAEFPNPDRVLLPGMFVRATLAQGSNAQALLVTQAAVSRNARGQPTVLVVDEENKVSERVIEVGDAVGSDWVVTSGLQAGERVIVEGLQKARAGMTVTPAAPGAPATAAPAAGN